MALDSFISLKTYEPCQHDDKNDFEKHLSERINESKVT